MHRLRWSVVALILVVAALLPAHPVAAHHETQSSENSALSPYWGAAVRQWESLILEEASYRGVDPDLVAAVIWRESLGRSSARGPAGAVGLMMVMPKEAGFTWRPTAEQLEEPWRNVFWGTRALATVIQQSRGDLYTALAAYNGGWEQIHLHGPNRYATDIIGEYTRAVAMRYGLSPEGHWVATVAAVDESARGPLTVVGPQRPLTRYSVRPVAACIPDATTNGQPTAVAFSTNGQDMGSRVGVWIAVDGQIVHGSEPQQRTDTTPEPPIARSGAREVWMVPEDLIPRGV